MFMLSKYLEGQKNIRYTFWRLVGLALSLVQQKTLTLQTTVQYEEKLGDHYYLTQLLPKPFTLNLYTAATLSQYLSETFYCNCIPNTTSVLPLHVQQFKAVFSKNNFNTLSDHHKQNHTIELIPGAEPQLLKLSSLSSTEQSKLNKFIVENIYTRCIWPSKSPIAAPVFFIKKKDGFHHLVQDYRNINVLIIKNRYLLSLISELNTKF